jgi:XTP/dITP diphosphohydrolase/ATP diphosphatase
MALRGCNLRFRERFRFMEMTSARPLEELEPNELEALWAQAKRTLAAECGAPGPEPHP